MDFNFQNKVDKDKVFIVNRNKLEKRLDPFYYIPSLVALEEKVKEQKPLPLRHYVKTISSGATPKTTEYDKYYSDKENGIPFLRVQNLSSTGILDTEKVKYINETTHENYLKRSQVAEGDLLVKITGVGRMAIASVAPDGFVGNTNQHMVVIKTGSKEASQVLAAYLNTDIAEALASRRATGGTRPALDYPALLSIPIISSDEILRINKKAIESKQKKEKQAKELLESIDAYLLNELGIKIPKKENNLKNRIYTTTLSKITNRRLDPFYNDTHYLKIEENIDKGKFDYKLLKELCYAVSGVVYSGKDQRISGLKIIRANNITLETNELNFDSIRYIREDLTISEKLLLKSDDILMSSASGSKEHVGKVAYISEDLDYYFGGFMNVLRKKDSHLNQKYLFEFLQSSIFRAYLFKNLGGTNINNLGFNAISHLKVPYPTTDIQNKIVEHINIIREKAKQLKIEAIQLINDTQKEIQKIILSSEN